MKNVRGKTLNFEFVKRCDIIQFSIRLKRKIDAFSLEYRGLGGEMVGNI
jgi:hypothetical protein